MSTNQGTNFVMFPNQADKHDAIADWINFAARICHEAAVKSGWWIDVDGKPLTRNKGEMLMLMVSEISEAMEGERKNLMDDHLPLRKMAEVELADAIIRIFDYAGAFGYDLGRALVEKLEYNARRLDHKREAREAPGGKKF